MSLQHIQKNSPGLLPKPAKFEKNPPNGYRVIRKTKCGAGGAGGAGGAAGAGGAGGARSSPIHKQASLAGRLIRIVFYFGAWTKHQNACQIAWVDKIPAIFWEDITVSDTEAKCPLPCVSYRSLEMFKTSANMHR